MSACYYVNLKLKVAEADREGLVNELRNKIMNDTGVNYGLERFEQEGVGTESLDELMRIFLAGWQCNDFKREVRGDTLIYTNGFNASYGWESVMIDMFKRITPYLQDGSSFNIDIENEYDSLVVKNGKCVQLH